MTAMKTMLRILMVLNLGLLGCLICAVMAYKSTSSYSLRSIGPGHTAPTIAYISVDDATASSSQDTLRFHWSQLESSDYPTYITKLRRVGCPERTIRDIITADVGGLYSRRREELEKTMERAGSAATDFSSRQEVDRALQALREEEKAV